jgi:hypothetical protein
MARPIPLELPERDPREELLSRLEKAPAEHAAAILAGFEVLQGSARPRRSRIAARRA